ncbi:Sn1-specific diacylglycerol lipase, partial [Tanacetum coccineum]
MAATTMATAAGAMVLLYYVLARRLSSSSTDPKSSPDNDDEGYNSKSRRKIRPAQAPATWFETMTTLSETLRFTYSETLGKWPLGDLAFGINYLLRRQGNVQVASVYAGENSVQLKGPEIIAELKYYLWLLTIGILFSKKPFP